MSEENFNFEFPDGIVNAYEYGKTDKDGVNDISKRREMEKDYSDENKTKYSKKALEIKERIEYYREKINHLRIHEE